MVENCGVAKGEDKERDVFEWVLLVFHLPEISRVSTEFECAWNKLEHFIELLPLQVGGKLPQSAMTQTRDRHHQAAEHLDS